MIEEVGFRSSILDTISTLQGDAYVEELKEKGRLERDDWKDFGVEILDFYRTIRVLYPDIVPVQILGYPGSGKSFAASFLNPDETYWIDIDKKPFTFTGARQKWPPDGSKKNYRRASTYKEVLDILSAMSSNKKMKKPHILFILGHIEDYTAAGGEKRQRLQVLGRMATKQNIEGGLTHCYYTQIDPTKDVLDDTRFRLLPHASGYNTARSPQGLFKGEVSIPNNFQLIVDRILADWNGTLQVQPSKSEA